MSNALSVPTVTAALCSIVRTALERLDLNPGAVVAPGPLDDAGTPPRVGVHLHRVSRNPALSVADLPTRSASGALASKPRAALDLHYLFTFRGTDDWQTQLMLAGTAAVLHSVTGLSPARIAAAEADHPEIADNDLAEADEPVRITPDPLSSDELTRLWALYPVGSYTVTLAVVAGPVLVDAYGDPGAVLPVRKVLLRASPFASPPRLDTVAGPEGSGAPVRASVPMPDLHLHGHGLSAREGETVDVLIDGGPAASVTTVDDTHLVVVAPPLAPGVRRVRVRRTAPPLDPALTATRTSRSSETVAVAVVPTLGTVTAATGPGGDPGERSGTVTAGVTPPVTAGNRVRLLLDSTGPGPAVALVLAAEPPATPTPSVTFQVKDAPAGGYRVTLEIDGARSIPPTGPDGLYVLPVVTL